MARALIRFRRAAPARPPDEAPGPAVAPRFPAEPPAGAAEAVESGPGPSARGADEACPAPAAVPAEAPPPPFRSALGEVLDWLILGAGAVLLAWAAGTGLTFMPSAGFLEHRAPLVTFERAALLIGAAAILRRLLGGRVLPGAPLWGCAAAAAVCLVSLIHTTDLYTSREEVFLVAALIVLVLAVLASLGDATKTHAFLGGLVAVATGEALVGLWQYASGAQTPAYWLSRAFAALIHTRAYGTLGSPNVLAGFLLLGAAGAVILAVSLPVWWRPLPAAALVVQIAALVLTYSRGGYVGLGVFIAAAVVLLWPARRRAWPVLLLVIVAAAVAFVKLPNAGERAQSIAPEQQDTGTSRLFIWRTAIAMWGAHPIWGTGIGTFNTAYSPYRRPGVLQTYAMLGVPGSAHDDYLQILATTGVVGAGLLVPACLWGAWRAGRRYVVGGAGDRAWIGAWGAGVLGLAAVSLVDENLFVATNVTFVLLLSAGVAAQASLAGRPRARVWQRWFALPMILPVALLPPLLGPPAQATALHDLATRQVTAGNYRAAVATFRAAMAADPLNSIVPAYFGDLLADLYVRRIDNSMGPWRTMRDRAAELYRYAAGLNRWDAYPHAELGRLERLEGRYADAVGSLQEAIRLDPYTPRYRLWLAEALLANGDRAAAAEQLRAAVSLFPVELLVIEHHEGRDARYAATTGLMTEAQRLLAADTRRR